MTRSPLAVQSRIVAGPSLPPVVLLHGLAGSGAEDFVRTGWVGALSAAGRSAHVIDLPGHGDSPAVDSVDAGRTSALVAAIADTIAATGASEVDVIAYSLGARLAWELPTATDVIRRLVLGGISPFEPFASLDLAALRAAVSGSAAPVDPLTGMMAGMIGAPGLRTDSLLNLIGGLAAEPFDPHTDAPRVPTLFVAGEEDAMTDGIEDLVALVPGALLTRVPGDHRAALDGDAFRAAALRFLS